MELIALDVFGLWSLENTNKLLIERVGLNGTTQSLIKVGGRVIDDNQAVDNKK